MKKAISFILFSFLFFAAKTQNLNGIWSGKLVMAPGACFPVYNIELRLQVNDSLMTGSAYHFSDTSNYVRTLFQGEIKKDPNLIVIQETGTVTFRINKEDCVPCVKRYELTYHKGSANTVEEQLRGTWSGKAIDGKTVCDPGTVVLTRFSKSVFQPNLPKQLLERKNELVKTIYVDTGNIRVDFYDNGIVDGDTISVFVNDDAAISRKQLSTKPVSTSVRIDLKHLTQDVIMVGENYGTIPPNTALMMLYAGDERYQLYLSSDSKKNAMVRIIYEKLPEKRGVR